MGDRNITCSHQDGILKVYLPGDELKRILTTKMVRFSPNKSPIKKMNRSSLGSAWTPADIQELYDLRQAKKSWSQIGKAIKRSGGAAQQQWIRMQRENHPLLRNDQENEDQENEHQEDESQEIENHENERQETEHHENHENGYQEKEEQDKGEESISIEEESKGESTTDGRDRRCCKCDDYEASNVSDLATCSVCHNSFHRFCHQPPIAVDFFGTTDKHWSCANCTESESKIGTAFAERLHTAVSEGTAAKRGRKRKRRISSAAASEDGAEPEIISVAEELKTLKERVQELQEENAAMQKRIDDVVASQEAELSSFKETVKGLKANAAEKAPSSPINGWFSKAKRFPGFGGT